MKYLNRLFFLKIVFFVFISSTQASDYEYQIVAADFITNWKHCTCKYPYTYETYTETYCCWINYGCQLPFWELDLGPHDWYTVDSDQTRIDLDPNDLKGVEIFGWFSPNSLENININVQISCDKESLNDKRILVAKMGFHYTDQWRNFPEITITPDSTADWQNLNLTGFIVPSRPLFLYIDLMIVNPDPSAYLENTDIGTFHKDTVDLGGNHKTSVYIKNLTCDDRIHKNTFRKQCENCENADQCIEDFTCFGYASKDDPTDFKFGKCVPAGTMEDICGVTDDDEGCFLKTIPKKRNSYIPIQK